MPTLFCFGLGYSAQHYIAEFGGRFDRIAGTVTTREKAAAIAGAGIGGHKVDAFVFDGTTAPPEVTAALMDAAALLVSAPPDDAGDPVLRHFAGAIAGAPQLQSIVYLSTVGVYGDHGGAWVDEATPAAPISERSRARLVAEQEWQALAARAGKPVAIFRLSGIYGPGQNALIQVARGSARRIDKPGQVFNRIHVADIAQAIDAAFTQRADGVFNVTDDEPTPQGVPVAFAAELARRRATAGNPLRRSGEVDVADGALVLCARASACGTTSSSATLGVRLRYPSYKEGLRALRAREELKAR